MKEMLLGINTSGRMGSILSCTGHRNKPLDHEQQEAHLPLTHITENNGEQRRCVTNDLRFKLIQAAATGDIELFKRHKDLLKGQSIADYDGRTPLHLAATEGHINVVRYLIEELENDPEVNDRNKKTAYDEAVKENHRDVVEYLESKMNPTTSREKHEIIAAACYGDLDFLKRKYTLGTNMSVSNYDRRTPLHLAAAEGQTDVVKFLLEECKVDVNVKDRNGQTALDEAIRNSRFEIEHLIRQFQVHG